MAKRTEGEGWAFVSNEVPGVDSDTVSLAPEEQNGRIRVEKRKKGKVVTLVTNLALAKGDMKDLAKALRQACGTGGTFKEETIELQGDCQERAKQWLLSNGWRVR
jgi:translation initiation factor 1